MERKTIFDLVSENYKISDEVKKIHSLLDEYNFFFTFKKNKETKQIDVVQEFSFFDGSDSYLFEYMPGKDTCLDIYEFMRRADAYLFGKIATIQENQIINYIEVVENFFKIFFDRADELKRRYKLDYYDGSYDDIRFLLDRLEKHLGLVKKDIGDRVVMINDNAKLIAAVDKLDDADIAFELVDYERGEHDYKQKRKILKQLDRIVEPMADKIRTSEQKSSVAYKMASDLGYLLNNFDIRHNNTDPASNDYKQFLNGLTDAQWEEIYDMTYELILDMVVLDGYSRDVADKVAKYKKLAV